MANKDQRRGNREVRKPKQAKAPKPAAQASPFVVTAAKMGAAAPARKK